MLLSVVRTALFAATVLSALPSVAQGPVVANAEPAGTSLPPPETIKACLKGPASAECLDLLFRESLKSHSTLEALQYVQRLEATDAELRRDCHPVVHAIGRETFLLKGSIHDSFAACDQTCHSGCYHGSVERFLRGDALYARSGEHPSQWELRQKVLLACDPKTPMRLRYQCLHGLGHAIMFFAGYNIANALDVCDALENDWSRNSCYGGVFMENVVNGGDEKGNFSPTDFHVPCNRVDVKYRNECYGMQTSRMTAMGLPPERIFEECAKAGEFDTICAQSLGRDLSNDSRVGDQRAVARKCEIATGNARRACVHGVVNALADNTWDGRFALPFCAALGTAADQDDCFNHSRQYLALNFEIPAAGFARECSLYVPDSGRCQATAVPR